MYGKGKSNSSVPSDSQARENVGTEWIHVADRVCNCVINTGRFVESRSGDVGVQKHPTLPWDTAGKEALEMTLKGPTLLVSLVCDPMCHLCDYEMGNALSSLVPSPQSPVQNLLPSMSGSLKAQEQHHSITAPHSGGES
ncbi:hypothetical protein DUI87_22159 [Hirundo rustica rustica]|uniref:Uncharacterized protein n=1 Tax=Hirundo rustica rustica TaxID=333673 RepID=A0A3M0JR30_HIRRU|nr:hypothetical protein DUI87_22159 [Hirundo rustica rustica]